MFGPLPARYRYLVLVASLLACLGLALWLAGTAELPLEVYLVGLLTGGLVAFVLLHDFSHRPSP
jgi:fatty acid desaturase